MKKLKPKKVWMIFWLTFGGSGILGLTAVAFDSTVLSTIAMVWMFAALAFYVHFYRCPKCGRFLGRGYLNYCGHCGKNLDED